VVRAQVSRQSDEFRDNRGVLHVSSLESFTNSSEQVRPLFVCLASS
jgi:hypothetical protein